MNRFTLTLAAAALATTVSGTAYAQTSDMDVPATYNTRSQQFCLTSAGRTAVEHAMHRVEAKSCRTAPQWRVRGIRFEVPALAATTLAAR